MNNNDFISNQTYRTVKSELENDQPTLQPRKLQIAETEEQTKLTIASNLKALRQTISFTQVQMSQLLDISTSQYKKYESGVEVIRYDITLLLAIKLGYSLSWLFSGTEYEEFFYFPTRKFINNKIIYLSNRLSDEYFKKLCTILHAFTESQSELDIPDSGLSMEDFERAIHENREYTYVMTAGGIKAIRHHMDYTQEQMAELLKISVKTYQEYEKNTQTPKYNIVTAARYNCSIPLPPIDNLKGSHLAKVRKMQNIRISIIEKTLLDIHPNILTSITPIIDSFFDSVRNIPRSQFF